MNRGTAVVFAKVPEAGRVKTRLQPAFSAQQASGFYAAMLGDVLEATIGFARELGLAPSSRFTPGSCARRSDRWYRRASASSPQRGDSLSAR